MTVATGRLDRIVADLERLQREADEILNTYTDQLVSTGPSGTSWGVTKYQQLAAPAGSTFNRIEALKILKDRFLTGK
jgi:hypothetical protein